MIYSCFPPFDQAQDGFVCVCWAEEKERYVKEREIRKKKRKKIWERKEGTGCGFGEIRN